MRTLVRQRRRARPGKLVSWFQWVGGTAGERVARITWWEATKERNKHYHIDRGAFPQASPTECKRERGLNLVSSL
jgi:hypothetical protein